MAVCMIEPQSEPSASRSTRRPVKTAAAFLALSVLAHPWFLKAV